MADELDDAGLAAIALALEGCPSADFKARVRASLQRSIDMTAVVHAVPAAGIRPGFTAVTPCVIAANIDPFVDFATQVFGAVETLRTASPGGVHAQLRIGDSMLFLGGGDAAHDAPGVRPRLLGLHVYVDDVDAAFRRAIAAGATSLGEPADRPYGERAGFVKDAAGNHWYIATAFGRSYHATTPRTVTPHLVVHHTPGRGAAEFIAFTQRAFGADLEMRHDSPEGLVMHAVVRIREAAIELGETREAAFDAPAALYLYVEDCDATYRQAIEAGAIPLHAPADQPYGDRVGGVTDPWGNEWYIGTYRRV